MAIFIAHIISDNHTDIVKLQALGRMYAPCFIDRFLTDCKGLPIVQVPADTEISDFDIMKIAVFSTVFRPVPAVSRKYPGPVVRLILFYDGTP